MYENKKGWYLKPSGLYDRGIELNKHPKVPYTTSKWVHVINGLSVVSILGAIMFVIVVYPSLPDTIPIHFTQGEADGWGSKATIFLMPGFALLLFIPLYFLSKAPHVFNYPITITEENAPRIYPVAQLFMTIINFECVVIFTYLSVDVVGHYLGMWLLVMVFALPLLTILVFVLTLIRLSRRIA